MFADDPNGKEPRSLSLVLLLAFGTMLVGSLAVLAFFGLFALVQGCP